MESFLDASTAPESAPEGVGPPMTAAEYSESVYQWLVQAHQWHTFVAGMISRNFLVISVVHYVRDISLQVVNSNNREIKVCSQLFVTIL